MKNSRRESVFSKVRNRQNFDRKVRKSSTKTGTPRLHTLFDEEGDEDDGGDEDERADDAAERSKVGVGANSASDTHRSESSRAHTYEKSSRALPGEIDSENSLRSERDK